MHPGNIFVRVDDPADPQYAAVDFGIVGTLDPSDQNYLAANFLAVFDRDYRRVATLHVESGWVPPDARVDEMESAVRTICEPIFEKPLKDISFGVVLLRLFEVLRRFDARIQPQLLLLQKTLFNVEGLGRQLYPELDIWKTASPILREWMAERRNPAAIARRLGAQLPDLIEALELLPVAMRVQLRKHAAPAAPSTVVIETSPREHGAGRGAAAIAASLLVLSGTIWIAAGDEPSLPGRLLVGAGIAWLLSLALRWRST
jgi:ubiquinone biosynthesis protein